MKKRGGQGLLDGDAIHFMLSFICHIANHFDTTSRGTGTGSWYLSILYSLLTSGWLYAFFSIFFFFFIFFLNIYDELYNAVFVSQPVSVKPSVFAILTCLRFYLHVCL